MYISQASNFRNLNKIAKLNTRKFLELPITTSLSAQNINTSVIWYAMFLVLCNVNNNTRWISIMTLLEATKETGNKLFNKINWKIREIKMQRIFYEEIVKLRCGEKLCFTVVRIIQHGRPIWAIITRVTNFKIGFFWLPLYTRLIIASDCLCTRGTAAAIQD